MTDTQNDTSELDAQLDALFEELGIWYNGQFEYGKLAMTPQRAKQALTTLIAQREQAAELRGRIDELKDVRPGKDSDVMHLQSIIDERLADLQATKPEKEEEE